MHDLVITIRDMLTLGKRLILMKEQHFDRDTTKIKKTLKTTRSSKRPLEVFRKWRHGLGGGASRILWQEYLGICNKRCDDGGRGVKKCSKFVWRHLWTTLCHTVNFDTHYLDINIVKRKYHLPATYQVRLTTLVWNPAMSQPCRQPGQQVGRQEVVLIKV